MSIDPAALAASIAAVPLSSAYSSAEVFAIARATRSTSNTLPIGSDDEVAAKLDDHEQRISFLEGDAPINAKRRAGRVPDADERTPMAHGLTAVERQQCIAAGNDPDKYLEFKRKELGHGGSRVVARAHVEGVRAPSGDEIRALVADLRDLETSGAQPLL